MSKSLNTILSLLIAASPAYASQASQEIKKQEEKPAQSTPNTEAELVEEVRADFLRDLNAKVSEYLGAANHQAANKLITQEQSKILQGTKPEKGLTSPDARHFFGVNGSADTSELRSKVATLSSKVKVDESNFNAAGKVKEEFDGFYNGLDVNGLLSGNMGVALSTYTAMTDLIKKHNELAGKTASDIDNQANTGMKRIAEGFSTNMGKEQKGRDNLKKFFEGEDYMSARQAFKADDVSDLSVSRSLVDQLKEFYSQATSLAGAIHSTKGKKRISALGKVIENREKAITEKEKIFKQVQEKYKVGSIVEPEAPQEAEPEKQLHKDIQSLKARVNELRDKVKANGFWKTWFTSDEALADHNNWRDAVKDLKKASKGQDIPASTVTVAKSTYTFQTDPTAVGARVLYVKDLPPMPGILLKRKLPGKLDRLELEASIGGSWAGSKNSTEYNSSFTDGLVLDVLRETTKDKSTRVPLFYSIGGSIRALSKGNWSLDVNGAVNFLNIEDTINTKKKISGYSNAGALLTQKQSASTSVEKRMETRPEAGVNINYKNSGVKAGWIKGGLHIGGYHKF